jgi:hypothetical protein
MPEDRSLSELTTSEYLLLNSDKYKLTADTASTLPERLCARA